MAQKVTVKELLDKLTWIDFLIKEKQTKAPREVNALLRQRRQIVERVHIKNRFAA